MLSFEVPGVLVPALVASSYIFVAGNGALLQRLEDFSACILEDV